MAPGRPSDPSAVLSNASAALARSRPCPRAGDLGPQSRWHLSPAAAGIFSVSFLLLFTEMALIRWIPAQVRILAYFSSLVLVAAFLGTGVGCIAHSRRDWMTLFPWSLLTLLVLAWHLGRTGVQNPSRGYFFRLGTDTYPWAVAVPLVFVVTALTFVPLGQRLARGMAEEAPLVGYSANLLGSLLGTACFAAISYVEAPPAVWFASTAVIGLLHIRRRPLPQLLGVAASIVTVLFVHEQAKQFLWSPYYKISVAPLRGSGGRGYALTVNDDYHQLILDLSAGQTRVAPSLAAWTATYDFPYLFARSPGAEVLVLGAGTGNDVAAALRNGASRVDAVELDPRIARLGLELHPERPYADPRVRVVVNDARSVINSGDGRYDLLVFGWLDSHRVFSSLSSVRQDNFVYTVDAMRRAMSLLKPGGALVLSFYAGKPWVAKKIDNMLRTATSRMPRVFAFPSGAYGPDGTIFVVPEDGHWPASLPGGFVELTPQVRQGSDAATPPTDRWPFLYWERPGLSGEYAGILVALLLIAAVLVLPELRFAAVSPREGAHFFLLGAGFLLLEVRNITALALVYGSTWVVTSVVVAAVLGMALFANLAVGLGWGERRVAVVWAGLFGSIIVGLLWSQVGSLAIDPTVRAVMTTLVTSATFIFTGVIFAHSFKRTSAPGTALGLNVLGSVFGGVTEFCSLFVGLDGLVICALVLYTLAALSAPRTRAAAGPVR